MREFRNINLTGTKLFADKDGTEKPMSVNLRERNWNDWGFATLFYTTIYVPRLGTSLYLGDSNNIRLFDFGQTRGAGYADPYGRGFISFIYKNVAEWCLLFLTPDERQELVKILRISFDDTKCRFEEAYKKSVLRWTSKEEFLACQREVKTLMESPIDMTEILSNVSYHYNLSKYF